MSYLTPERLPVGYSVTRARAETNYSKETLAIFDRIPSRKAALIWLALKFGFRDDSVSILTEGLGSMPFHGRTAILVDESTTGAGERIAAFAQERKLAPVVGARTAGKLICCSVYKVGHGYYRPDSRESLVHLERRASGGEGCGTRVHCYGWSRGVRRISSSSGLLMSSAAFELQQSARMYST